MRAPRRVDNLAHMDELIMAARDSGHVHPGETVAVLAGAGGKRSTDVLRLARVP